MLISQPPGYFIDETRQSENELNCLLPASLLVSGKTERHAIEIIANSDYEIFTCGHSISFSNNHSDYVTNSKPSGH